MGARGVLDGVGVRDRGPGRSGYPVGKAARRVRRAPPSTARSPPGRMRPWSSRRANPVRMQTCRLLRRRHGRARGRASGSNPTGRRRGRNAPADRASRRVPACRLGHTVHAELSGPATRWGGGPVGTPATAQSSGPNISCRRDTVVVDHLGQAIAIGIEHLGRHAQDCPTAWSTACG